MTATSPAAETADGSDCDAIPASEAWCIVCRRWRPYRTAAILPPSFKYRPGYTADTLKCGGCATTLLAVRAPSPPKRRDP